MLIPLLAFWTVLGGPLGEEIGWRGYALPRLQKKYGWLQSSLILGLGWFGWHLVRYLDPGQRIGGIAGSLLFAIQVMIFSILFSWVFYRSANNLFIVVLFHGAINSLQTLAASLYPGRDAADFGMGFTQLTIALIVIYFLAAIRAGGSLNRLERKASPERADGSIASSGSQTDQPMASPEDSNKGSLKNGKRSYNE